MSTSRESPSRAPLRREELTALGDALMARADDCCRLCEERLEATHLAELGTSDVGSDEFRSRRRANQRLGAQLIARYLQTGDESTPEERKFLGGLGDLAARSGVSMFNMTRGYLLFRDVVDQLLAEEAARLGTPPAALGHAKRMNLRSCEASILWMTRQFDDQSHLQKAELGASEARFRGVFESMAHGVVLVDSDGTVLSCNEAAAAMLGFTSEALVGVNVCANNPSYRDEHGAELRMMPIAEVLATGRPIHGLVVRHDSSDGRPARWHQLDAIPILDARGQVVQVLASISDITAVKTAEEIRLEGEAKNRFLATMSHELRTPLNSILGFAQLLAGQAGKLDERQRRYVANIESSGKHLLELISAVLELSRAASGQIVVKLAAVDLLPLVEEVLGEFEPMVVAKPVGLRADLEPGLLAMADGARLHQVLENLIANALKFTETGSVTVTGRTLADHVEIRVIDTGIGVPADQLERVFDEFTQVDTGWTRSRGGTGLGLPLSRRLVEMMDGVLTLESALGKGTTAIVRLPQVPG